MLRQFASRYHLMEHDGVAATAFGLIHRVVGVDLQGLFVQSVVRVNSHTDAG
jgi:hypothetical protein